MSITKQERPGVYSSYDASSVISGREGGKLVGVVAINAIAEEMKPVTVTTAEQAMACFGAATGEGMSRMIQIALANGAAAVVAVAIQREEDYEAAFEVLERVEGLAVVLCGSTALAVQQMLRASVERASEARRERIGIVGIEAEETVEECIVRAGALNSARMVLIAPTCIDGDGIELSGQNAAAAVAGAIAGESDPAVPLGGAELLGLGNLAKSYSDNEIDLLIRGGVTVLEQVGGTVSVVRGVTTKTKTDGVEDKTWRELNTILVVDDVIPTLRAALRSKFKRAKNTEQSRSAIRSQVILELENKKNREIITGYEQVRVSADEENPTVCQVDFSFTVAHGLNQIWITAHIAV